MTTDTHHHITLEMDKLRDAKDHPAKIQVSFNWCLSVCVYNSISYTIRRSLQNFKATNRLTRCVYRIIATYYIVYSVFVYLCVFEDAAEQHEKD